MIFFKAFLEAKWCFGHLKGKHAQIHAHNIHLSPTMKWKQYTKLKCAVYKTNNKTMEEYELFIQILHLYKCILLKVKPKILSYEIRYKIIDSNTYS